MHVGAVLRLDILEIRQLAEVVPQDLGGQGGLKTLPAQGLRGRCVAQGLQDARLQADPWRGHILLVLNKSAPPRLAHPIQRLGTAPGLKKLRRDPLGVLHVRALCRFQRTSRSRSPRAAAMVWRISPHCEVME
ncbi:hypothetical protein CDZ96_22885 [Mameliella alba]|nr:hypothetical protein CDZ96_22885 [Mameliella alba]